MNRQSQNTKAFQHLLVSSSKNLWFLSVCTNTINAATIIKQLFILFINYPLLKSTIADSKKKF